jgi:hypothetical protein
LRAAAWDVGLANAMAAQDNPVIYPIQRSGWPVVAGPAWKIFRSD